VKYVGEKVCKEFNVKRLDLSMLSVLVYISGLVLSCALSVALVDLVLFVPCFHAHGIVSLSTCLGSG
jgi:uncharacterized protein involved in cysteine biosynthesis